MHRRSQHEVLLDDEPLPKKLCVRSNHECKEIKPGAVVTDNLGNQWRLGKAIGTGGFGEIYLASNNIHQEVKTDAKFIAKVEGHGSGPLFVEINYYLRSAKEDMIKEWIIKSKLTSLGVPHYVASGSQTITSGQQTKYRFLILPRFEKDLEQIFVSVKRKFNLKTVLTLGIQLMDILEYTHSQGFIHSDIKASNLLVGNLNSIDIASATSTTIVNGNNNNGHVAAKRSPSPPQINYFRGCNPVRTCRNRPQRREIVRNLRPIGTVSYYECEDEDEWLLNSLIFIEETNKQIEEEHYNLQYHHHQQQQHNEEENVDRDQVYLFDYGLASKYVKPNGDHKEYCKDNRRAHAGTTLFCSLDAHCGSQSRRSDLESLGYNMIYWLTSHLPWMDDIEDPEIVESKKQKCMSDLKNFLQYCFGQYPKFIYDYLEYIRKLRFDTKPNYQYCKKLFRDALKEYGYENDMRFDFENTKGWGQKIPVKKLKIVSENTPPIPTNVVISKIYRQPLRSNLTVGKRALTRNKKTNSKKKKRISWSKILMDPEEILKKARAEKSHLETSECNSDGNGLQSLQNLNIWELNPTPTMIQVYDRIKDRLSAASGTSPKYRGDHACDTIEGFTPTMVAVYNRKKEREQEEYEMVVISNNSNKKARGAKKSTTPVRKSRSKSVVIVAGNKKRGSVKSSKETPATTTTNKSTSGNAKKKQRTLMPTKRITRSTRSSMHRLRPVS